MFEVFYFEYSGISRNSEKTSNDVHLYPRPIFCSGTAYNNEITKTKTKRKTKTKKANPWNRET